MAVRIRAKGVILMLQFTNMLQPFVFPSKGSGFSRAIIIWAFPRALRGMFGGVVSLEFMLVFEWPFVGAAGSGA
jgi:hypothetical protein